MNREVTDIEIRDALFSLGDLKALGPNGFLAIYYQKCWNFCKEDIYNMVRSIFVEKTFLRNLNSTHIVLIPKIKRHIDMSQLRPISLCDTTYKIISKILLGRLRGILKEIISPARQALFRVNTSQIMW